MKVPNFLWNRLRKILLEKPEIQDLMLKMLMMPTTTVTCSHFTSISPDN